MVLGAILGLIFLALLVWIHQFMVALPDRVSTYAAEIDTVYYVIYYITGVVFILVTVVLAWFLIKYRSSQVVGLSTHTAARRSNSVDHCSGRGVHPVIRQPINLGAH